MGNCIISRTSSKFVDNFIGPLYRSGTSTAGVVSPIIGKGTSFILGKTANKHRVYVAMFNGYSPEAGTDSQSNEFRGVSISSFRDSIPDGGAGFVGGNSSRGPVLIGSFIKNYGEFDTSGYGNAVNYNETTDIIEVGRYYDTNGSFGGGPVSMKAVGYISFIVFLECKRVYAD